jgi:hypothetical protein
MSGVAMRTQILTGLAAVGATAALAALPMQALAAEEAVISAFSVWQGQGQFVNTAPEESTFVGSFAGKVYVNTESGPIEAGQMVCPAVVRIETASGKQTGTGNCTITSADGAQLFSTLTCSGVHLVGCSGEMKLIGGSGRFKGVAGGGTFTVRSSLNMAKAAGAQEPVTGIIFWPELHYTLP